MRKMWGLRASYLVVNFLFYLSLLRLDFFSSHQIFLVLAEVMQANGKNAHSIHSKKFYLHLGHTCQVDQWKCVFRVDFEEFVPHVKKWGIPPIRVLLISVG
jgi:hypothetical protein